MFLAFEIMEEASLRQPGGLADLVHRSGCVTLGQHQLLGGVEQLLFGQRIALGYVHGAYIPVGMTLTRASSGVKPVFRESSAECYGFRIRRVTWLAGAMVWPVPQLGALIAVQTISGLGALVLVAVRESPGHSLTRLCIARAVTRPFCSPADLTEP